ncbi:uncharacterized protein LOC132201354 [Neocloeon triangulifer]|uniref:uncharacterized protein LOC132201354 n=1 Tax=Neocloeon triangulifer TaxID=2078957 RepID=UPI00286ECD49|nr:uncharacterized protein LOC132201354 [Neocloeon triangulifer]
MTYFRRSSNWYEGFRLVELDERNEKFTKVKEKVAGALKISKVYDIHNSTTYAAYVATRDRIRRESGTFDRVSERYLFHGSPYAKEIAEKGFHNQRTFFSDKASYSDSYARKNGSRGTLYMLVCKVVLGRNTDHGHSGDEFHINDATQAFPSFLIEYDP